LNPFVIVQSGRPFNITVGRDLNGDTVFTDRPAFATDLTRPSVIVTQYGAFDRLPLPGSTIIPRNFAEGPGSVTFNLRVSKTWSFGKEGSSSASNQQRNRRGNANDSSGGDQGNNQRMLGGMGGRGPGGGGPGGGGGGGGRGGGGGGGGFGGFGGGGGGNPGSRYSLTFSMNFNNILNHANLGNPVGNLSSRLFGESTATAGGFGGFGAAGSAYNRRIDAQLRFTF
jgi:hypothetical protein